MGGRMKTELEAYKILVENAGYGLELNMNDIFAWGCADSETLDGNDAEELIPIIQKYGDTALIAYASVKRAGAIPQPPVLKNIKKDFYAAQEEIQKLANDGTILYEEYYEMEKRRKEITDFDGQTSSWSHFSDRFINILNKDPKFGRCVVHVARLKDGTFAVGRSYHETSMRLKRKYDRKKAKLSK
jgi:hypothetical protein